MRYVEDLRAEHRDIERVLSVMESMALRLESDERVEPADLDDVFEVLRDFVDRCHHGKEEIHLMPELARAGVPLGTGLLADLLDEHEVGRTHVSGMARHAAGASHGDGRERDALAIEIRTYVELMRGHIDKEERRLFPLSEERLGDEQAVGLARAFDALETYLMGAGRHGRLHAVIERLEGSYRGVERGRVMGG